MAAPQVISIGLGAPSNIPWLLTLGLGAGFVETAPGAVQTSVSVLGSVSSKMSVLGSVSTKVEPWRNS